MTTPRDDLLKWREEFPILDKTPCLISNSLHDQLAGSVRVNVPHAYVVSLELLKRRIIVDYREWVGIRIAHHFYNTDD